MENLLFRKNINDFNSGPGVIMEALHLCQNLFEIFLNALSEKGHLLAYPTSSVTSGSLSNQLLVSRVSISACLKKIHDGPFQFEI